MSYCQVFHLNLDNIDDTFSLSSVIVDDFNTKCTYCWAADKNQKAGKRIDSGKGICRLRW